MGLAFIPKMSIKTMSDENRNCKLTMSFGNLTRGEAKKLMQKIIEYTGEIAPEAKNLNIKTTCKD
jgi:hypothetical protein